VIKVVEFFSYLFGQITAGFFIPDKPAFGIPWSVSVKIIDPVFKRFLFNQHKARQFK
jgi:hypothetical protein